MSIFPRKISWTEPWEWEVSKERVRHGYKELRKNWVFCLILFALLVVGGVYPRISRHINNIGTHESLIWGRIVIASVGYGVLFLCLPCLIYVFPYCIHVMEKCVVFQQGSSGRRIDAKNIISLSFETRDGRRYFVVKARNKKGLPCEHLALMAKKKVTEEDVKRFLYDVNLAHLYVVSNNQNEKGKATASNLLAKKTEESK